MLVGCLEPPSGSTVTAAPSASFGDPVTDTTVTSPSDSKVPAGAGLPFSMSHSS